MGRKIQKDFRLKKNLPPYNLIIGFSNLISGCCSCNSYNANNNKCCIRAFVKAKKVENPGTKRAELEGPVLLKGQAEMIACHHTMFKKF